MNDADCKKCARMIVAASAQATEHAIMWLELIEKHGLAVLPKALADLRAKAKALSSTDN